MLEGLDTGDEEVDAAEDGGPSLLYPYGKAKYSLSILERVAERLREKRILAMVEMKHLG